MTIQKLAQLLGITPGAIRQKAYRGQITIADGQVDDLTAQALIHAQQARTCRNPQCRVTFTRTHSHQEYCTQACRLRHSNETKKTRGRLHPLNSVHIAGVKGQDRRVRLSESDKEEIRYRHKNGQSITSLAKDYDVNKRAIQFTIFPERYEHAKLLAKIRRSDGRYKPTKEEQRILMADHRAHKRKLLQDKGILP